MLGPQLPYIQVSKSGSVVVEKLMEIERYSHVMHISSTVTGQLQPGLDSWDALRAALPAGTVSGAPKVRQTVTPVLPVSDALSFGFVSRAPCARHHTFNDIHV